MQVPDSCSSHRILDGDEVGDKSPANSSARALVTASEALADVSTSLLSDTARVWSISTPGGAVLAEIKSAPTFPRFYLRELHKQGDLGLKIQVRTDPSGYTTRLRYHASVYMHVDGALEEKVIGYIDAWCISKPCAAQSSIDSQAWVSEWLEPSLNTYGQVEDAMLASVLRALYQDNGQPRPGLKPEQVGELGDEGNAIVIIQDLEFDWEMKESKSVRENQWTPALTNRLY